MFASMIKHLDICSRGKKADGWGLSARVLVSGSRGCRVGASLVSLRCVLEQDTLILA